MTEEKQKHFYPGYSDYSSYEDAIKNCHHNDPFKLRTIFKKVYEHLFENRNELPLVHFIGKDQNILMGSSENFFYKRKESYVDGFHNNPAHHNKLCLKSWDEKQEKTQWIPVSEEIVL